jgi:hypothetical protein
VSTQVGRCRSAPSSSGTLQPKRPCSSSVLPSSDMSMESTNFAMRLTFHTHQAFVPCFGQVESIVRECSIAVTCRERALDQGAHGPGCKIGCRMMLTGACVCARYSICTTGERSRFTVQDGGQGFNADSVADSTTPENRLLTQGRRIYLMKTLIGRSSFRAVRRGCIHAPGV